MFSLKALWIECNPHQAPDSTVQCHSNYIHHAEANSIDDSLSTTRNKQGSLRLQAYYLDQLDTVTSPMDAAPAKGARLLAMTKSRALTQLRAGKAA